MYMCVFILKAQDQDRPKKKKGGERGRRTYSFFLRTGKVGTNVIFADPPGVVVARFPIAFDGGGGGGPVFGRPDPEGSDILCVSRF